MCIYIITKLFGVLTSKRSNEYDMNTNKLLAQFQDVQQIQIWYRTKTVCVIKRYVHYYIHIWYLLKPISPLVSTWCVHCRSGFARYNTMSELCIESSGVSKLCHIIDLPLRICMCTLYTYVIICRIRAENIWFCHRCVSFEK